ncbi:hypothetical protein PSTG_19839, partial [Puccinia striiformis f. sp. tritici PST-78]
MSQLFERLKSPEFDIEPSDHAEVSPELPVPGMIPGKDETQHEDHSQARKDAHGQDGQDDTDANRQSYSLHSDWSAPVGSRVIYRSAIFEQPRKEHVLSSKGPSDQGEIQGDHMLQIPSEVSTKEISFTNLDP